MPGRIQELNAALIDQIAAGEVIERPASVVKELLENALDAQARRIRIELEGGGSRRIRITDDGQGIHPEYLPLAVRSHATSKLRRSEDLFAIATLGFRGEALASIASVSHLTIRSRQPDAEAGAVIRVDGGDVHPVKPEGMPPGTEIEVADLFYNVPARRNFLKTARSEYTAILAEVRRQALCHHHVSITVVQDGKEVLAAPCEDEPRERIAQVLGRDLAEDLLNLPPVHEDVASLRGYVTPCDRSRGNTQQQFFFLNGRAIRDVTLLTAVRQAYANLLPPRRHPSVLLWIDVAPAEVDVNVHPQKAEVRFQRSREVFFVVKRQIERVLRESGLVAELHLQRRRHGLLEAVEGDGLPALGEAATATLAPPQYSLLETLEGHDEGSPIGRFLQLHRRYILEETPQGVRLVDPHALHERILYEEIRARLREAPLESQRFLFPQIVDANAVELAALEEREALLTQLGFEVTPFGQNALAVHAAPRLLKAERVGDTLSHLLEQEGGRDAEEEEQGLLHDLAASLACRSAVRFGEQLPDAMIAELLRKRAHVPRGHCCPHGRPTGLALSPDELDRKFGRQGVG